MDPKIFVRPYCQDVLKELKNSEQVLPKISGLLLTDTILSLTQLNALRSVFDQRLANQDDLPVMKAERT